MEIALENMMDVELGLENAVDRAFLVPPLQRDFGGASQLAVGKIRLRVGERPIALDLRQLFEKSGRTVPDELELYVSYNVWVLSHHISILREGGWQSLRNVGFVVRFAKQPRVTVLTVLPSTEYVNRLELTNEAEVNLSGGISASGETTPVSGEEADFGASAKLKLSTSNRIVGRFSVKVITPLITATGVGDFRSEWLFSRHGQPLVGDLTMLQVVLVPRNVAELRFFSQLYATVDTWGFLPARLEGKEMKQSCALGP